MEVRSKAHLAVILSKLKGFSEPKASLEQYETDSETAAFLLWNMLMLGDIEGKTIADLGAGTGKLGTGCGLLGAKKVYLVESEDKAIETAKKNLESLDLAEICEPIKADVREFNKKTDVVVQNPPFGTRQEHADKAFLEAAINIAGIVYSLHKTSTASFVRAFARACGYSITHEWPCKPILWQTLPQHRRQVHRIDATWFRLEHNPQII